MKEAWIFIIGAVIAVAGVFYLLCRNAGDLSKQEEQEPTKKQRVQKEKPERCIDPVIKYCQGCRWGHVEYPAWVETAEDLEYCSIKTCCTLGYDQGRPEDEPTEAELEEYELLCEGIDYGKDDSISHL